MYPKTYVENFREFRREKELFVMMPFSDAFGERWERVIVPSATAVGLRAFRVDSRVVSDSILSDILSGISRATLLVADVSTDANGYRNANVLYELGLAHAVRQPEE